MPAAGLFSIWPLLAPYREGDSALNVVRARKQDPYPAYSLHSFVAPMAVWVAVAFVLALPNIAKAQAAVPPPPGNEAVDPITGVVRSRRLASGRSQLGGIGTGTFQILTDGVISQATINNNWSHPTSDLPACFAAIHARAGVRTTTRVLALSNAYGLPGVRGLDFEGLYPVANLGSPILNFPLRFQRACSPR